MTLPFIPAHPLLHPQPTMLTMIVQSHGPLQWKISSSSFAIHKANPRPASGPIAFVPKYFRRWPFLHSAFLFPSVMFKYIGFHLGHAQNHWPYCSWNLVTLLCGRDSHSGYVCEALNDVPAFCFSLLRGQYLKKKSKDK